MKPLRAVVIGVGYLGKFHAEKYAALPGVELVAVADPDIARAQEVSARLGCRAVPDFSSLLGAVDIASIVVPTEHHYSVARACLEAGIHILVEKPVTRTLEEAADLIRLAAARRRVFQVGHVERFNPAVLALQQVLEKPLFVESYRLASFKPRGTDVDVVLDLMIHDIDIILNLVRSDITDVRPIGFPVLTDEVDIGHARIEFASGCVANVTASRVSDKAMRKVRVFQQDAYLSIDLHDPKFVCWRRLRNDDGSARLASEERTFPQADLLLEEVRAFVEAARNGTPPLVSGVDGKRALEVALRISAGMGQAWPPAGPNA
ncbi:MAG TPA: Gfo/Idh/MocA family oxidoreductase [Burkholderiales bacterium]|nr:Gfo/Idh/MocA family oxidoreductase [Burkholderiales bacterium]